MTAVIEPELLIGPHTTQEWRDAPEPSDGSRLELIWGYWHVSPGPTPLHQNACFRICRAIDDTIEKSERQDLHAVQAVAVEISTAMRYGLIPDVGVVNQPLTSASTFPPEALELAVEVWSPGNRRHERETKMSGYAVAGVPYLWTIEIKTNAQLKVQGFILKQGIYQQVIANDPGDSSLTLPGPIPVTLEFARLLPKTS